MKHQLLDSREHARTFACVFDIDDDVVQVLQDFCQAQTIAAAALCYYDMEAKRYEPIAVEEQVEVLSFFGNVTTYEDKPKVHVHCVVGRRGGQTAGGHLIGGTVRPTLELFVQEQPGVLRRSDRPDIGIPLIDA